MSSVCIIIIHFVIAVADESIFIQKGRNLFRSAGKADMLCDPVCFSGMIAAEASQESQERHFNNALSYLIHQQGCEIAQADRLYYGSEPTEDKFLENVVAEMKEFPGYGRAELTALVTLGTGNLDIYRPDCEKKA